MALQPHSPGLFPISITTKDLSAGACSHSGTMPTPATPIFVRSVCLPGSEIWATVTAEDLMAYVAAIAAHPAYTARFQEDLSTPGLRIPVSADGATFGEAVGLGRKVIWLHTFGERMADAEQGRPAGPPRLPPERAPYIPAIGAIPDDPTAMPDVMDYDADKHRLLVGQGYIETVAPAVWL